MLWVYLAILIVVVILIKFVLEEVISENMERIMVYEGIDIESSTCKNDFVKIKNSGIKIAYIKASQGLNSEQNFKTQVENAHSAGMYVGIYHTIMAQKVSSAIREAQYFVEMIRDVNLNCKVVVRVYEYGNLNADELSAILQSFINVLEDSGVEVMIYSDAYMAEKLVAHSLTVYPLWIVRPVKAAKSSYIGSWSTWTGEEYTSIGEVAEMKNLKLSYFKKEVFWETVIY